MWNGGSTASMRSSPSRNAFAPAVIVSRYCALAAVRLACVSIAPFGSPVVPPVYCSTAIASAGSPMRMRDRLRVAFEQTLERDDALAP